jgi:hypothetical protein
MNFRLAVVIASGFMLTACRPESSHRGAGGSAGTSAGGSASSHASADQSGGSGGASAGASSTKVGSSASPDSSGGKSASGGSQAGASAPVSSGGQAGVSSASSSLGGSDPGGAAGGVSGGASSSTIASGGSGSSSSSSAKGSGTSAGTTTIGTSTGAGTGGTSGASSSSAGVRVDSSGTPLASPGDSKNGSSQYLNLGDFRLINNKWGSDSLGCKTTMRVFVNSDRTMGWEFNRATCGGNDEKPDYPEIEFGIHPFGSNSSLVTSPTFASTTLLPLQIKDINSASVTLDSLSISLQNANSWNLNVEFWLSQRNPLTDPNPGVHAEVIAFWGWENGRWPCDKALTAKLTAGDKSYHLCHQSDTWNNGQWRYFQFWVDGGPLTNYSGKVDIKAFLSWLASAYNYSKDLWVARIEVGSEIDDNTSGSVKLKNITFEVNGTSKSVELAK